MIREDRFLISRKPYAVDLGSLFVTEIGEGYTSATVDAIWFRRRRGQTVAVYGELWDHQNPPSLSAAEFLARHDDGRYGGRALARWDGSTFWTPETPFETAQARWATLQRALTNYPKTPHGHDGWWTFSQAANDRPLTGDECVRLFQFLAERGHADTIHQVFGRVAYEAMMRSLAEVTA